MIHTLLSICLTWPFSYSLHVFPSTTSYLWYLFYYSSPGLCWFPAMIVLISTLALLVSLYSLWNLLHHFLWLLTDWGWHVILKMLKWWIWGKKFENFIWWFGIKTLFFFSCWLWWYCFLCAVKISLGLLHESFLTDSLFQTWFI